ncbi:MAG: RluA family pseudouridine synthase [Candidatus Velthaea sp.]
MHHRGSSFVDPFVTAPRADIVTERRIEGADAGTRTDVLVARLTGLSRSYVATAIKNGAVTINDIAAKPSTPLEADDLLRFEIEPPEQFTVIPQDIPLDVVFEDETLIVVNKPAGMVTHPAHGATDGTLVNALLAHVSDLPGEKVRGGLIHRLDRDTSGLLVVAKTEAALGTLGRAMQQRYIKREYLGLVDGTLRDAEGTVRGAIGRDPRNRQRYAIRTEGKPAVTHYAVREVLHAASELVFRLETGRTHQIRVHMMALGHPIINDPLYGRTDSRLPLPGQALHAWRLEFKHPVTKEYLTFEVEPPPEYLATLAFLKL